LTASALSYYAAGLWAFAALRVAVAAFFALQDSRTPMVAATISILANTLLGLMLMQPMAHAGLALATSLAAMLNLVMLLVTLHRKIVGIDWRCIGASLARSVFSAAVMALGVSAVAQLTLSGSSLSATRRAAGLSISMAAGVLIYLTAGWAVGSVELRDAWSHLKRSCRSR
jgi:putative peptidoglycan lipid II flippase